MKIAVLGSGNGGCAVAFDCANAGHEVSMFDFKEFPVNIEAINRNGGIYSEGALEGLAKIKYSGHDIEKALNGAEVIYIVGPAYSTKPFGEICKPYIRKGQIYIVCPSSCGGGLVFKNAMGLNLKNNDVIVGETNTLPYAVRIMEPGKIRVFLKLKGGLMLATIPGKAAKDAVDLIKDVYPVLKPGKNVLQTTLLNANPVIHPAVTLLNAALIERTNGDFLFYEEGVTKSVGRLIEAVDKERIAIGKRLGLEIKPDPEWGMEQGYMQEPTYDKGYSEADGFRGIKAQSTLNYRYFNEDVGYGLVFMADLAKRIGVETPLMDSIISIVSVLMGKNYREEKMRTIESLGLGECTLDDLQQM